MPYAHGRDGTRLFYERFGRAGGRTVLLVMGLGANGRIWRPSSTASSSGGYDVLTFDNRGLWPIRRAAAPVDDADDGRRRDRRRR